MRLLISVRNAAEAAAALAGGADIVDGKEPLNGALGAVSPRSMRAIVATVAGDAPVSAALGDAGSGDLVRQVHSAAERGISFLKIGFAGLPDVERAAHIAAACVAVAQPAAVILVSYADYPCADAPSPAQLISVARRANAAGILLDTYDKRGPGLTTLLTAAALQSFVNRAKGHGQVVALAGKLRAEDIALIHDTGADIAGLRGAACAGPRTGAISTDRVQRLRAEFDRVTAQARPVQVRGPVRSSRSTPAHRERGRCRI